MQANQEAINLKSEDAMRGKYLTFRVEDGVYGISIVYVTDIVEIQDITPVPHTFPYVKGIINLRGTIIPIIDMRLRFGKEAVPYTDRTCIIVLTMDETKVGLVVEEVDEVLDIGDDDIQPPPRKGGNAPGNEFVCAVGLSNGNVKQLLDINKIFEVEDAALAG